MRVIVRGRQLSTTPALDTFVRRRLGFALDRFADRVRSATVRLADVNGPRGGLDKTCSVHLELASGRPVIVSARDEDLYVAIGRAVSRASEILSRRSGSSVRQRATLRKAS